MDDNDNQDNAADHSNARASAAAMTGSFFSSSNGQLGGGPGGGGGYGGGSPSRQGLASPLYAGMVGCLFSPNIYYFFIPLFSPLILFVFLLIH